MDILQRLKTRAFTEQSADLDIHDAWTEIEKLRKEQKIMDNSLCDLTDERNRLQESMEKIGELMFPLKTR